MRVHANQVNPYAQLDAMHAAQKAAAKREAARTRKKLFESASGLSGENEFEGIGAVTSGAHEGESGGKQPDQHRHTTANDGDTEGNVISDWA
jgi:hypothetical protein